MSAEHNKMLARRYAALVQSGTLDGAEDLFSPDFKHHAPGAPTPLDLAGWKHFTSMFQRAFPDLRYTIENMIAEGDTVAERVCFEGTHRGDFQGLPPTGKRVSFTGMQISRVSRGQIVELWGEFDAFGMLQQLGGAPSPDQRQAVRTIVEQAFDAMTAQDLDTLVALVAPDCDWVDAGTRIQGAEQLRGYMQGFYTAFPDFRLAIQHAVQSGDTLAAETRFTGTHAGPLRLPSGEVAPTGKAISLEGCDFIEVEAGKIKSWHTYANMAAFMAQLGMLPAPATATAS